MNKPLSEGRLSKWRAQRTVNAPSETVPVQLRPSPPKDVDGSSNGRAFDCDSKGCEFDSRPSRSLKAFIYKVVRGFLVSVPHSDEMHKQAVQRAN